MKSRNDLKKRIQTAIQSEEIINDRFKKDELNRLENFLVGHISKYLDVFPQEIEMIIDGSIDLIKTKILKENIRITLHESVLIETEAYIDGFFHERLEETEKMLGITVAPIKKIVPEELEKPGIDTVIKGLQDKIEPITEKEIFKLNEQLTMIEGSACENLINTLNLITAELCDEANIKNKSQEYQRQWHQFLASFNIAIRQNIAGMMKATRIEEFRLYQEGLASALDSIALSTQIGNPEDLKTKFFLNKIEKDVLDFEFGNKETKENLMIEFKKFSSKEMADAGDALLMAKDKIEFNAKKVAFLKRLREMEMYSTLMQTNLLDAIYFAKRQVTILADTRSSYLEESPKFGNIESAWVIGGIILVGAALTPVLPVALPAVITAVAMGVGVAGASAGYGVVDFSKTISESLAKRKLPEFGERDQTKFSPEVQKLLGPQEAARLANKRKQAKALTIFGITLSGVGLMLGVAGVGLAMAGIIAGGPFGIAAAATAVALVGGGLLLARHIVARRQLKQAKNARDSINDTLKEEIETLNKIDLEEKQQKKPELVKHKDVEIIQAKEMTKPSSSLISNPWIYEEKNPLVYNNPKEIETRIANVKQFARKLLEATVEEHGAVLHIKLTKPNGQKALIIVHPHKIEANDFSDTTLKICAELVKSMGWQTENTLVNDKLGAKASTLVRKPDRLSENYLGKP